MGIIVELAGAREEGVQVVDKFGNVGEGVGYVGGSSLSAELVAVVPVAVARISFTL